MAGVASVTLTVLDSVLITIVSSREGLPLSLPEFSCTVCVKPVGGVS